MTVVIDFSDKTLFGNEDAEDELEEIFFSYAVEREEVSVFLDPTRQIAITRAYKGEGKSALLRLVGNRLQKQTPSPLIIGTVGSAISPELESSDSDKWVRGWKTSLLRLAASEIGSHISFAFSDDAISLVEEAEQNGFKSRSFVSTITDRLESKAIPLNRTRADVPNPEALLKRWSKGGSPIWFIVDDIDQNFQNTPYYRVKVATFFVAIRQLANLIPEFRFRLAVRPNVWTIVKHEFEALSHVEQYIKDLRWSLDDYYILLARRIEGYLKRTDQWRKVEKTFSVDAEAKRKQIIELAFEDLMPWGHAQTRPPAKILYTLSRQRPRWLIELCKEAAKQTMGAHRARINFSDINSILEPYGKRRIEDTIAEFNSQCPQIEELLVAFVEQPEWFSTAGLLKAVNDRILQGVKPKIAGVLGAPSSLEVAHFLFQIGFLTARKNLPNGHYEHVDYSENPALLSARTNIDQGYSWEIHPAFRQALKLKNVKEHK